MTKKVNVNRELRLHYCLLFGAVIVGTYLSGPEPDSMPIVQWLISGLLLGLLAAFPLFFFIPTVLRPTPASVSWLSFFLLAYLVWAIVQIFSPKGMIGGLMICTFNLTSFFYAVVWLRPFKKSARARASEK